MIDLPDDPKFIEACRTIVRNGYTPVDTDAYGRLRAWCDLTGWPPKDWEPGDGNPEAAKANTACKHGRHFGGHYCEDCEDERWLALRRAASEPSRGER